MREGAPWGYSRDIGITTDTWVSGTKWKHEQVERMEGTRVRKGGIEGDLSDGEISDGERSDGERSDGERSGGPYCR